jgi:hypothetical protein
MPISDRPCQWIFYYIWKKKIIIQTQQHQHDLFDFIIFEDLQI